MKKLEKKKQATEKSLDSLLGAVSYGSSYCCFSFIPYVLPYPSITLIPMVGVRKF